MRKLRVGLEVGIDPHDLSSLLEDLDKDVLGRVEPHVVKLCGRDSANQPVGEFTGTMCSSQPIIWTTGHALHFGQSASSSGATSFVARYFDGTEERVSVLVQPEPGVDLLILQGTRTIAQDLHASIATRCDAVYVLGCRPGSTEVSVDRGMVSALELDAFYVTAHADAGWSGGPVVNKNGRLMGLVQGSVGTQIKYLCIVPVALMHAFAVRHGQPGLSM
jgi:hypothetical protein